MMPHLPIKVFIFVREAAGTDVLEHQGLAAFFLEFFPVVDRHPLSPHPASQSTAKVALAS
jgi:hypothetical protein